MRTLVRLLPELTRLLARLVRDPSVPTAAKVALGAAALYLLSPVDLLPDLVPVLGYLDDLLLASVIVDGVLSYVDRRVLLQYWPGTSGSLDQVARVARLLAVWVPRRVKARIFSR